MVGSSIARLTAAPPGFPLAKTCVEELLPLTVMVCLFRCRVGRRVTLLFAVRLGPHHICTRDATASRSQSSAHASGPFR